MVDYVSDFEITSAEAFRMARFRLMAALGCGFEALSYPDCTKLLGPVLPGTGYVSGSRLPATAFELDRLTSKQLPGRSTRAS